MTDEALPALFGLRQDVATVHNIGLRQVMADGIIAAAARAKNWPLVEEAARIKLGDQDWFANTWWTHNVSVRESQGSHGRLSSPDRGTITIPMRDAERQSGVTNQQVARWRAALREFDAYLERIVLAARRKAYLEPEENHRAEGTGEFEWYTPPRFIAAARAVMGTIDLDPASHAIAQRTVQATEHFTIEDDGLSQEWRGRVWLNPPYSQPAIEDFAKKMVEEVGLGHTTEAVMLTHNYTDTAWFHIAASACAMICFTRGRIRFINQQGEEAKSPTQGQAFFYYGPNCARFADVFGPIGLLVSRYAV